MAMFPLSRSVLLVSMRAGDMVGNTNALKKGVKFLILTSPISLHGQDLAIKKAFNKLLKEVKLLKNIRLIFE